MNIAIEKEKDVEVLKTAIIKAMEERPELFKKLFKEVFFEKNTASKSEEDQQLEAIDAIISRDFKRFDKVFKALA